MSLIICPECGAQISDKAKNCIKCGYPLSKMMKLKISCPECGMEVGIDDKECKNCGYPLKTELDDEKKDAISKDPQSEKLSTETDISLAEDDKEKSHLKRKKIIITVIEVIIAAIAIFIIVSNRTQKAKKGWVKDVAILTDAVDEFQELTDDSELYYLKLGVSSDYSERTFSVFVEIDYDKFSDYVIQLLGLEEYSDDVVDAYVSSSLESIDSYENADGIMEAMYEVILDVCDRNYVDDIDIRICYVDASGTLQAYIGASGEMLVL